MKTFSYILIPQRVILLFSFLALFLGMGQVSVSYYDTDGNDITSSHVWEFDVDHDKHGQFSYVDTHNDDKGFVFVLLSILADNDYFINESERPICFTHDRNFFFSFSDSSPPIC